MILSVAPYEHSPNSSLRVTARDCQTWSGESTALFAVLDCPPEGAIRKEQGSRLVASPRPLHRKKSTAELGAALPRHQNGAVDTPKETVHGMNPQGDRG